MKKYNLILKSRSILFIASMLIFLGCEEEFLIISPNHIATEGNFYETEDDFDQAVIAVYGNLQNYVKSAHFLGEGRSDNTTYDNLLDQGRLGGTRQYAFIDQFKMTSDVNAVSNAWSIIYDAIKDCNVTLTFLETADIDPDFSKRVEGELKFFRAYFHFVAVRYWGDIPLLLAPINSPEEAFAITRAPIEDVYQAIIQDAEKAVTSLPFREDYSGKDTGRVSKEGAIMLLAKVYLTRHQYDKAQTELNSIIGKFSLLPDYASIFNPENKNHDESIFEVQFKEGSSGESSNFAYQFAPLNSRGVVVLGPEAGGGSNIPTLDMVEAYEANDLRKEVSLGYFDRSPSPLYYVKKYDNDSDPDFSRTPDNWPIYRYADALLMLAEAINEQSYQTGTAFDMLNMVRARAGLPELTPTDLPNQESLRNAIADERRVELAFENHRWFDLLRTGKAIEVMTAHGIKEKANPTLDLPDFAAYGPDSFVMTADKLLYPIPIRELTISPNLEPQNAGY